MTIATAAWRALGLRILVTSAIAAVGAFAACSAAEHASGPFADFARTRVTITGNSGSHTLTAWIADTPAHRTQGLMFVRTLAPDAAMIFFFESPRYVSMWMKNTYVSLDMLFIDDHGRITNIAHAARPLSLDLINSPVPVSAVLELTAGTARRLGLEAGDRVSYAQIRP